MNLDDLARFAELDTENMRARINDLPGQVAMAWALGQRLPVSTSLQRVDRIVIAGMGTGALVGDMLAAMVADSCNVPILVHRGYELPAYAEGHSTLVIGVSHDGDDEETLSALEMAEAHGTQVAVLTAAAPSVLSQQAEKIGAPVWAYHAEGPARVAFGAAFTLLASMLVRLGLVPDMANDVALSVETMRARVELLSVENIAAKNPAKRTAGQLIGRVPVIYGAGILGPVAHRWKTQLNENAKSAAYWEELPEISHNSASGIHFPSEMLLKLAVLMLTSPQFDHPRVKLSQEHTRELYLEHGIALDTVKGRGSSHFAQMMSQVQFGDYVSYYVAMAYEVDPTPVHSIDQLKDKLRANEKGS